MNTFKDFTKVMWSSFHSNKYEGSMHKAFIDITKGEFDVRFNNTVLIN